jgi:hypothetical protein
MVAVLNWGNDSKDFAVPVSGRGRVKELWSGKDLGVWERVLKLPAVPPRSGRLYRVTPDGPG